MDVVVVCWNFRVFIWFRICDVYVILKWFINLLISCFMVVLFIVLLWKIRLVCFVISIFIFCWVEFDNGFELVIVKFFFIDFDLCINFGIMDLVELESFEVLWVL